MNRLRNAVAFAISLYGLPTMARADVPGLSPSSDVQAFDAAPVGDELLASLVGGQRTSLTRDLRSISDAGMLVTLQQTGQTSRMALENWWSQTGAALIANNLLANGIR